MQNLTENVNTKTAKYLGAKIFLGILDQNLYYISIYIVSAYVLRVFDKNGQKSSHISGFQQMQEKRHSSFCLRAVRATAICIKSRTGSGLAFHSTTGSLRCTNSVLLTLITPQLVATLTKLLSAPSTHSAVLYT